jgi:hypothetical protein
MFTWPGNRMHARRQPTPPLGKPLEQPQWKLDVTVAPGFMTKDNSWIPAHHNTVAWPDRVQVVLELDGVLFDQSQVGINQHRLINSLPDSAALTQHELRVNISGLQNNIMTDNGCPMLLVSISVENIVLDEIMDRAQYHTWDTGEIKKGSQYLGQDGQLVLRLTCPIYVWLMDQIGEITPYKHHKLFQKP